MVEFRKNLNGKIILQENILKDAIDKLAAEFETLDLTFHKMENAKPDDVTSYFPGSDDENILVCVFKGNEISEPFHRQDFFFVNYAWQKNYNAISAKSNNLITIQENECYIGQPYSGYALRGQSSEEIIIVGILIRREYFFIQYLPTIYTDESLFNFFVEPQTNKFAEDFIHLSFEKSFAVRKILEVMIVEYANRQDDAQNILKFLFQALLLEIARSYKKSNADRNFSKTLSAQIMEYMCDHLDVVTLKNIADNFSYHPNYISSLLHKETGKTFTKILLEKRMSRAAKLLKNTNLSIEKISEILGYSTPESFYKSFREFYHTSPRNFLK